MKRERASSFFPSLLFVCANLEGQTQKKPKKNVKTLKNSKNCCPPLRHPRHYLLSSFDLTLSSSTTSISIVLCDIVLCNIVLIILCFVDLCDVVFAVVLCDVEIDDKREGREGDGERGEIKK